MQPKQESHSVFRAFVGDWADEPKIDALRASNISS